MDEKGVFLPLGDFHEIAGGLGARPFRVRVEDARAGAPAQDLPRELKRLDQLAAACARSFRGLVHVGSAGRGPTTKSRKIRYRVGDRRTLAGDWHDIRTATVPASLVEEHDKKLWVPSWLLRQKLEKLNLGPDAAVSGIDDERRPPPAVEAGIAGIREALAAKVEELTPGAAERAQARQEQRLAKWRARFPRLALARNEAST